MRIFLSLLVCFFCSVAFSQEAASEKQALKHPLYIGAAGGYGSTTWNGLVPTDENMNMGMRTSTPLSVTEGGGMWGAFIGYEISPHFALEASYARYPHATVFFDEESLFAFENNGFLELHTDTDAFTFMAKIMLDIPRTKLRGYSSFGVAEIHRWDDMMESRCDSPTFGVGLVYDVTPHVFAELAFNYIAGNGESELNPAKDYVPFLYSGMFKLAYRI